MVWTVRTVDATTRAPARRRPPKMSSLPDHDRHPRRRNPIAPAGNPPLRSCGSSETSRNGNALVPTAPSLRSMKFGSDRGLRTPRAEVVAPSGYCPTTPLCPQWGDLALDTPVLGGRSATHPPARASPLKNGRPSVDRHAPGRGLLRALHHARAEGKEGFFPALVARQRSEGAKQANFSLKSREICHRKYINFLLIQVY